METINVEFQTKIDFEKDRNYCKGKQGKQISQDEFVKIFLKSWRMK